jgi:hypothetical protein
MGHLRLRAIWIVAICLCATAEAQDRFEIHVYEYEALKPGQFTLEQHLNYWAIGSKQSDGTVAPTNDQFHMTYEITGGITKQISLGLMQLNGVRPGGSGLEYAGWRLLPHFYAPKSWHLPVALGLVAELSFVRPRYAEDTRHIEIRPIVERQIGSVHVVFNPVFARALHGPGTRDGWQFEPAARIAYGDSDNDRLVPYLEWYSERGSLPGLGPVSEQVHQFFPGVDIKLSDHLMWSLGVGVGATSLEPRLVYKSRLEWSFGR